MTNQLGVLNTENFFNSTIPAFLSAKSLIPAASQVI